MNSITQIAEQFGLKPETIETSAGAVLNLVQEQLGNEQFQKILGAIPGAQDWVSRAAGVVSNAGQGGGGGLMGQLGGLLSSVTGGGGLGGLLSTLQQSGLNAETATQVVPAIVNMIKSKLSPELFDQVLSSVPALKEVMSATGSAGIGGLMGGLSGMFNKG